jgi:hypothetical protein
VSGYDMLPDGSDFHLNINDPYFGHFASVPYGTSFTYVTPFGAMVWATTIANIKR